MDGLDLRSPTFHIHREGGGGVRVRMLPTIVQYNRRRDGRDMHEERVAWRRTSCLRSLKVLARSPSGV